MKYLITLFLSFSVTVFSQNASQILNSLSEKTKSYKNISIDFDFNTLTKKSETILNAENVEDLIRGIEVSDNVSIIAQILLSR